VAGGGACARPPAPASPGCARLFGSCFRLNFHWGGGRHHRLCCRGRTPTSAPPRRRRCLGAVGGLDGLDGLGSGGLSLASHAGPYLPFRAHGSIGGVNVHSPHDDRGGCPPNGRPLLGQGPAGVDRLPGSYRTRKLPVQPLPFGHRGNGHVHGSEAYGYCHQEGRRGEAGARVAGVDREWGEVAGDPGKKRDLSLRDGAPPGRPLAAER